MKFYNLLKKELIDITKQMPDEAIKVISSRPLSPEEAIGRPDRSDYPLLKGKEFMIEAQFRGERGQAFTDMPGNFEGTITDLLQLKLENNFEKSLFIACFNAVMRYFGRTSKTIHCKDKEPKACAEMLAEFIEKHYHRPKIAFIGYQPAMIEKLSSQFELSVVDLDRDNIGANRFGLTIEDPEKTGDILKWCDVVLATGSTCANGTIVDFLDKKPVVFYGITIAGVASVFGLSRFCPFGK
ncbi:MAG TPA: DUF364 domain-containing protein [Syntrophorhabdaceae bacterium]|nr:DUF364 domain-containing protein [Syntrophorhabdaceae bacterium]